MTCQWRASSNQRPRPPPRAEHWSAEKGGAGNDLHVQHFLNATQTTVVSSRPKELVVDTAPGALHHVGSNMNGLSRPPYCRGKAPGPTAEVLKCRRSNSDEPEKAMSRQWTPRSLPALAFLPSALLLALALRALAGLLAPAPVAVVAWASAVVSAVISWRERKRRL